MPLIICSEKPFTPPVVNGHIFVERADGTWGSEVAEKFLPMFGIGHEGAFFRLADAVPPQPLPESVLPEVENPFPMLMDQDQVDAAIAECAGLSNKAAVVMFGLRLGLSLDGTRKRDELAAAISAELASRVK